jgi:outer membrane lipoprotein-sorting protein
MRGKRKTWDRICLWVLALTLVQSAVAGSDTPEERGRAIALEADRRNEGFGDLVSEVEMILRNRNGETSTRRLRLKNLEVAGDGDKLLLIFDEPADVKGTALLTFTHKTGPDDHWLFLPALKRVKRISSSNQSSPFVGSEFAYEDFTSQEVEKYAYRYLRDEAVDGADCFVVERMPVESSSGYTRQVAWLDKEAYRLRRVDYYDRKESLLKKLTFGEYRLYRDRFWRVDEMHMENLQSGNSTTLRFFRYELSTGLTERQFDQNSLKDVR